MIPQEISKSDANKSTYTFKPNSFSNILNLLIIPMYSWMSALKLKSFQFAEHEITGVLRIRKKYVIFYSTENYDGFLYYRNPDTSLLERFKNSLESAELKKKISLKTSLLNGKGIKDSLLLYTVAFIFFASFLIFKLNLPRNLRITLFIVCISLGPIFIALSGLFLFRHSRDAEVHNSVRLQSFILMIISGGILMDPAVRKFYLNLVAQLL